MITTESVLPAPVQQRFDMKLLAVRVPNLIHTATADKRSLTEREGDIMRMRRYSKYDISPVPLDFTTNPPPQSKGAVDIDAKIEFYGSYEIITKRVTLINEDPVLNEKTMLWGMWLRETEDDLMKKCYESTSSYINATGGTNSDNPTNLTRQDIDKVITALQGADGKFVTDQIDAEDLFGTSPIRDAYIAMCSTDLIPSFSLVQDFITKEKYPSNTNVKSYEWGACANMRFWVSSKGSKEEGASALGRTVYNIFVSALEAATKIDLKAGEAPLIYRPPGSGDDPLLLRQSIGSRFPMASAITNDAWLIKFRVTLPA